MKKHLFLFFALSLFTLAKAQAPKVDSTTKPKQNFSCGLKVNPFLLLIPNDNDGTILNGIDCSVYLQYKAFGVFGGLSPVYNSTLISNNKEVVPFINLGVFLEIAHFSPTDAIYLYLYDLHANELHINYLMKPPGSYNFVFYPYYKQTQNVVLLNPRYRATINNMATIECGVFFGFMHNAKYYNGNGVDASSDNLPCFGTNVSLGLNVAALFTQKKHSR